MSSKSKGTRYERELFHMFHNAKWGILRLAGSGSTSVESADLFASNGKRYLAIECKSLKEGKKYLEKERIDELKEFAKRFGAEAWFAVRFDNVEWRFLEIEKLGKSKKGTAFISKEVSEKNGLRFDVLIGKQKQLLE
jgi:holliday junction resolvase Hjr